MPIDQGAKTETISSSSEKKIKNKKVRKKKIVADRDPCFVSFFLTLSDD